MYEYIKGQLEELSPTQVVVEVNSIGYKILISLQTYSKLLPNSTIKLFLHHHLREDIELLYGFHDKEERDIFCHLIEVAGIGCNTARMMLSSMSSEEIRTAILVGDINKIKSIKGIGLKTAQRVLIELKDKIGKSSNSDYSNMIINPISAPNKVEAISALILLGFTKVNVEKVIDSLIKENPSFKLEELIKHALKRL